MTRVSFLLALILTANTSAASQWQPLFNGKDLTGWVMTGPGEFQVEDGQLKTVGGMGLLYFAGQKFGDCTIRVVFRTVSEHGNSGVVIRLPEIPKDPWYAVHNGYEVQIDAGGDEWHRTGAIYSISKAVKSPQKPDGEWNTMDIQLKGDHTIISLNGEVVNEFDPSMNVPEREKWFEPVRGPRPDKGYIGLQNHDARSTVYFKEVSVSTTAPSGKTAPKGKK